MADRNPARLAAPLALLAAAVAVVVVVMASRPGSTDSGPPLPRPAVTQPARHSRPKTPRAYVVKPGDTLTVIADKTGVTIEEIERLNPDVDPNALQTGERLELTP
ncbi:MAG TPA: LysM domain-containing protein [Conexibacter sp.]